MAGKREKPEDIVTKLRQVEVLQGQGLTQTKTPPANPVQFKPQAAQTAQGA